MTIVLTWAMFKWLGLILFVLGVVALLMGSLPDNDSRPMGDMLRWITWPAFWIWVAVMIGRSLLL